MSGDHRHTARSIPDSEAEASFLLCFLPFSALSFIRFCPPDPFPGCAGCNKPRWLQGWQKQIADVWLERTRCGEKVFQPFLYSLQCFFPLSSLPSPIFSGWHRWLEVFLKLKTRCKDTEATVFLREALQREWLCTVAIRRWQLLILISSH